MGADHHLVDTGGADHHLVDTGGANHHLIVSHRCKKVMGLSDEDGQQACSPETIPLPTQPHHHATQTQQPPTIFPQKSKPPTNIFSFCVLRYIVLTT